LGIKNVFKSLKALAGNNDRIFVILDDREDLWFIQDDTTDPISFYQRGINKVPKNLIKIPPFFYHHH
jgi:hypothetical protein